MRRAFRIVAAVLGGDRDAFRTLVEREAATVVRACARIVGDRNRVAVSVASGETVRAGTHSKFTSVKGVL